MMQDNFQDRKYLIQGMFILCAIILLGKAIQLQLVDTTYQEKASANVVQREKNYASRGLIFDRNGRLMVNNNGIYDLKVTFNQVKDIDTTKFCKLLNISKATFLKNLNKNWRDKRYSRVKPFVFLKKISPRTYAKFQESMYEFPGFFAELRNVRGYSYGVGAHVLGYIGEVNQRQVDAYEYYERGDYIGVSGIELSYEEQLRGRRGIRYILKDNLGRTQGSFQNGERDERAVSGKDLMTSIDLSLQIYGEQLLQNKRGSVVAIEPSTGEILSMISSPGYNPNMLTINRDRGEAYARLEQDSTKPLFNRALGAQYPPGSIFKPVMSLVALQEKVITPDKSVGCSGGYVYKGLRVGCHGHAAVTSVSKGIQHSCNAYFCQVFREVIDKNGFSKADKGLDTLVMHLDAFGLGRKLGVDLPNELTGNVPTSAYYDKLYRKGAWKSPTIISLGIGQGELLVTPLQMANFTAIIANRGSYYTPHIAKKFRGDTTQIPLKYRTKRNTLIEPRHFIPVVNGMEDVTLAGTARIAQIEGIQVCGKTGTAENPHGEDHSVFVAFAPKNNPKIAIAVFVENGGYGSRYAAPIASLMMERYLKGKIAENRKYLEKRMFEANLNEKM